MRRTNFGSSVIIGLILAAGLWAVRAQTGAQSSATSATSTLKRLSGPQTRNPSAWSYPDAYDSVTAAGEVYHTRYEDAHIRLVEVAYFPGVHTKMHGDPWPSVLAVDAPAPTGIVNAKLDPDSPLNGQGGGQAPPPQGMQYPTCSTTGPQAPYAVTNNDAFPLHFYRIEFKRIDGDGIKTNWKTWYPWMLLPLKPIFNDDPRDPKLGPPVSENYPFAAATESYIASPNNHRVLYGDDHLLFIEVAARPGERENLHGHANPSVFARDSGVPPTQSGRTVSTTPFVQPTNHEPGIHIVRAVEPVNDFGGNYQLDPKGMNGQGGGTATAPAGMKWPNCSTMGPQWPHAGNTTTTYALHFYRIQFKRIDGDGIKTHWREWYPWMAKLAYDYQAHPTPSESSLLLQR